VRRRLGRHHRRGPEGVQHDRRGAGEQARGGGLGGEERTGPEAPRGPDEETFAIVPASSENRVAVGRSPRPSRGRASARRARVRAGGLRPAPAGAARPAPKGAFTLAQVATVVGGRVHGDGATLLTGVATLEAAGQRDLSWISDERLEAAGARS